MDAIFISMQVCWDLKFCLNKEERLEEKYLCSLYSCKQFELKKNLFIDRGMSIGMYAKVMIKIIACYPFSLVVTTDRSPNGQCWCC